MWPRDAYVGQRVVCLGGFEGDMIDRAIRRGVVLPADGHVYTIRYIEAFPEGVGIRLVEIVNPKVSNFNTYEPCFDAKHFKPVDESRLDVFREMLNDCKDVVRSETV